MSKLCLARITRRLRLARQGCHMVATPGGGTMDGRGYIGRILAYRDGGKDQDSGFLGAVGALSLDGHDAQGMVNFASQAWTDMDPDDPLRPAIGRILEFGLARKLAKADAMGILALCDQALEEVPEPSTAPGM